MTFNTITSHRYDWDHGRDLFIVISNRYSYFMIYINGNYENRREWNTKKFTFYKI